jgi:hypothetical protein
MQFNWQQSWRHSLAAVALFSVLGSPNVPAAELGLPVELLAGSMDEAAPQDAGDQQDAKHAAAIREKLERLAAHIDELKRDGRIDEAEKLGREADDLKAILGKLADRQKLLILKEGKKAELLDGKGKKAADSIDALHERLRQLEDENAKLRAALGIKGSGVVEKGREDKERAIKEQYEKLLKEKADPNKFAKDKHDIEPEQAQILFEKALREYSKTGDLGMLRKQDLREKLERLTEDRAKLKELGRADEAEKLEANYRKLAEAFAKERADLHDKSFGSLAPELGAMIKELREEVNRLRHEVSELRQMVNEGGEPKQLKK